MDRSHEIVNIFVDLTDGLQFLILTSFIPTSIVGTLTKLSVHSNTVSLAKATAADHAWDRRPEEPQPGRPPHDHLPLQESNVMQVMPHVCGGMAGHPTPLTAWRRRSVPRLPCRADASRHPPFSASAGAP